MTVKILKTQGGPIKIVMLSRETARTECLSYPVNAPEGDPFIINGVDVQVYLNLKIVEVSPGVRQFRISTDPPVGENARVIRTHYEKSSVSRTTYLKAQEAVIYALEQWMEKSPGEVYRLGLEAEIESAMKSMEMWGEEAEKYQNQADNAEHFRDVMQKVHWNLLKEFMTLPLDKS